MHKDISVLKSIRLTLLALLLSTSAVVCNAQFVDTQAKEEKLSFADRISLKTNAIDWLTLTPNIGVEFDVRGTNWNRWAAVVNVKGNVKGEHTFTPGIVFEHQQLRLEGRNYWRTRQIDGRSVRFHEKWYDKLFSLRRVRSKHPLTTYYRGLYAAYDRFDHLFSSTGYNGQAITGGFTYGIVRPLYEYPNGNSIDFELGIAAGVAFAKYDEYKNDRVRNAYVTTSAGNKKLCPTISDIHVGFIYRLGKTPITKKYRYRYDVDMDFQNVKDSIMLVEANAIAEQNRIDTLSNSLEYKFWKNYIDNTDSEVIDLPTASKKDKKKAAKLAAKQKKNSERELKAAERRIRNEQKKAAKLAKQEAERQKAINNAKRKK